MPWARVVLLEVVRSRRIGIFLEGLTIQSISLLGGPDDVPSPYCSVTYPTIPSTSVFTTITIYNDVFDNQVLLDCKLPENRDLMSWVFCCNLIAWECLPHDSC